MKVTSIRFPINWQENPDISKSYMDVFVTLDDGYNYTVTVATLQNIEYSMDQEKKNFSSPGEPVILVKKFSKENIETAIKAFAEKSNGYWLKVFHYAHQIPDRVFQELRAEHEEFSQRVDQLLLEEDLKRIQKQNFDESENS